MAKEKKTEGVGKFPVNQATLAGLVVREAFNDEKHGANVTLVVTDGKEPKYLNVLISGKERYENFKKSFESALKELGSNDQGKQVKPCMFVTGNAFFSSNKTDKGIHQNFTLLATGDLSKNDDSYVLTANSKELQEFRTKFHQNNPDINNVNVRGNVSSAEIQTLQGQKGEFYKFSIAHNYIKSDESTGVMYANVIVPSSQATQMKQAALEKGSPVLFNGKVQPLSYQNAQGNKVYSFNLIAQSIQRDHSKSTSVKKAAEAIDKVAEVPKKKERLEEAVKQKDELKR